MSGGISMYQDSLNYFKYKNINDERSFQEIFAETLYQNDIMPLLNYTWLQDELETQRKKNKKG